jgi:hypothetical protein
VKKRRGVEKVVVRKYRNKNGKNVYIPVSSAKSSRGTDYYKFLGKASQPLTEAAIEVFTEDFLGKPEDAYKVQFETTDLTRVLEGV